MSKRSYSYSDYSSAVSCMRKYKLIRIDELKPNVEPSGDLEFGTAMHAAINACLRGDDYLGTFEMYWEDVSNRDHAYGRFGWDELNHLGQEFLRKFKERYAKDFRPQVMEKRLYAEYQGIKVEGTPDFVGKYKQDLVIADWKTSNQNYDKQRATVGLQLWLYAYLAITNLDFKPEKLLYLVFNKGTGSIQTPVTIEFTQTKMLAALNDMGHYLKTLDKEEYFPKNLNACIMGSMRCPYWETCHGQDVR